MEKSFRNKDHRYVLFDMSNNSLLGIGLHAILLHRIFYLVEYTASSCAKILRENKANLSTESINILGILELESIFWMNLVSLGYLRPK